VEHGVHEPRARGDDERRRRLRTLDDTHDAAGRPDDRGPGGHVPLGETRFVERVELPARDAAEIDRGRAAAPDVADRRPAARPPRALPRATLRSWLEARRDEGRRELGVVAHRDGAAVAGGAGADDAGVDAVARRVVHDAGDETAVDLDADRDRES